MARTEDALYESQRRLKAEALTLEWIERLIEPAVPAPMLRRAARYLRVEDYAQVVVERRLAHLCGYAPCDRPNRDQQKQVKPQYRPFCSATCYKASTMYATQLSTEAIWLRDGMELPPLQSRWDRGIRLLGDERAEPDRAPGPAPAAAPHVPDDRQMAQLVKSLNLQANTAPDIVKERVVHRDYAPSPPAEAPRPRRPQPSTMYAHEMGQS